MWNLDGRGTRKHAPTSSPGPSPLRPPIQLFCPTTPSSSVTVHRPSILTMSDSRPECLAQPTTTHTSMRTSTYIESCAETNISLTAVVLFRPTADEVLGDAAAAGRALDSALRAAPASPLLLHNRAALLVAGGRAADPASLDRAETLYQRVRRRPPPPSAPRSDGASRTQSESIPIHGVRRCARARLRARTG